MDGIDLLSWITNNGFAVAVAVYSLTRLEKKMQENTDIMKDMLVVVRGANHGK